MITSSQSWGTAAALSRLLWLVTARLMSVECMGQICVSVLQASLASLASFVVGAGVPLVAALFSNDQHVRLACVLVRAWAPAMAPCTHYHCLLLQLGAMWTTTVQSK